MCVCVCVCVSPSVMSDFATPWTVACQAPLSVEFSRHEYWIGLPFPIPGDNCRLLHLLLWQVDSLPLRHLRAHVLIYVQLTYFTVLSRYSVHCLYHLFILTHSLLSLSDTFHTCHPV